MGQVSNKIKQWLLDPEKFVIEALKVERITQQQKDGLAAYRRLIVAKLKRSEGVAMTPQEQEDAQKIGVSIESGQGTGKDAWLSWCILHFLVCTFYPKIICTAPTDHQLRSVLWSEIHKWLRRSGLGDTVVFQAEKIYLRDAGGKEWFAIPRTISSSGDETSQGEALQGFHEDFLLVVGDEASGIADPVFKPLEGTLTGKCNILLLVYNPTKNSGFAYESQRKNAKEFICLRWNAEESENVSQDHVNRMREKYGRDSNAYRIRVLGLPPTAEPDALVPRDWLDAAVARDLEAGPGEPLAIGVDVARFGDDSTVIIGCRGMVTESIHQYKNLNGIQVAEWVERHCADLREGDEDYGVGIDIIGVGASVYDQLGRYSSVASLYPVNVAESPANDTKFERKRDEILWLVREEFQAGVVKIPNHPDLIDECNDIKWAIQPNGKIKVEGKREMKKRGRQSPNFLDAYAIAREVRRLVDRPLMHTTRQPPWRQRRQTSWAVG